MILVLNNRDSFVHNLARYVRELGHATDIVCAQRTPIDTIAAKAPDAIIISPGPCTPNEAGISCEVVCRFSGKIPILGVCLGHQVIAQVFGGDIDYAKTPRYGQSSPITHDETGLFQGLPNPLEVGLYHSLIATLEPDVALRVQARSPSGEIMALQHTRHHTYGVQFHPESILSQHGHDLLANFLRLAERPVCT